jgi:hypothetical protein
MKVKSIDTYTGKDNQTRWRIHFEGDDKPLIMGTQPSFKVGDEIPQEKLKVASKGERHLGKGDHTTQVRQDPRGT